MATVMVVEDDFTTRVLLVSIISKMGHAVVPCTNGRMAYEILKAHEDVNLIVSDVVMPEMTGIELLEAIRKESKFASIPILLISAYLGVNDGSALVAKGAYALMIKPISPAALQEYMTSALRAASGADSQE